MRIPVLANGDQFCVAKLELAAKDLDRFTGHEDMIGGRARLAPFDREFAAAQFHGRGAIGAARQNRRDQGRTGADQIKHYRADTHSNAGHWRLGWLSRSWQALTIEPPDPAAYRMQRADAVSLPGKP